MMINSSMRLVRLTLAATMLLGAGATVTGQDRFPRSALLAVPFDHVTLTPGVWSERNDVLQTATLPQLFATAEKQGKLDNFRIVAGLKQGRLRLYNAPDSDIYRLIEAAGYSLAQRQNPRLQNQVQGYVDAIVAAQAPDGYLQSQFMIPRNDPRAPADTPENRQKMKVFGYGPLDQWAAQVDRWPYAYSQLFCAGHLMEAGCAWKRGTGDRSLFDAAIKFAANVENRFGTDEANFRSYADHPEIEIGLMRLYEETGDERFAVLAERFARYCVFARPPDLGGGVNRRPLHEQREAFGHAVRTSNVYAGASDVLRVKDAPYLHEAVFALWDNVTAHKMYVHGGVGNGSPAEQHGFDDDLPIGPAYSESCASIAQAQWNQALNLLTGQAGYAELVEWEAYNSALAALDLAGTRFFYSNKLNLGTNGRKNEHSGVRRHYLFCCPSKVPAFVAGFPRWVYAADADGLTVNQFVASRVTVAIGADALRLRQDTDYPRHGAVSLTIEAAPTRPIELRIRVPSYVSAPGPFPNGPYRFADNSAGMAPVAVNGRQEPIKANDQGYLVLRRQFQPGDVVAWEFRLEPRRIVADERIVANRGRVSLSRGPVLYCLEGVDNAFDLDDFVLPRAARLSCRWEANLLGGMTVIEGVGRTRSGNVAPFKAVPYYAWQNRGVSKLVTLLTEDPEDVTADADGATDPVDTNG